MDALVINFRSLCFSCTWKFWKIIYYLRDYSVEKEISKLERMSATKKRRVQLIYCKIFMLYATWDQEGNVYFGCVKKDNELNLTHGNLVEQIYIHTDKYWVELHTLSCVMNIYTSIMNLKFLWIGWLLLNMAMICMFFLWLLI